MNFTLRPWNLDDLDHLVIIANNVNIAKYLTNQFPHPYKRESGEWFIKNATSQDPIHIMAIDVEGKAVGAIGLHTKDDVSIKNLEMGYWLGEAYWGKGIMTEAIKEMTTYGFKNYDINRIYARPFGNNIGSQKALEKAGYELEARFKDTIFKNGEYLDELFYAIRKV